MMKMGVSLTVCGAPRVKTELDSLDKVQVVTTNRKLKQSGYSILYAATLPAVCTNLACCHLAVSHVAVSHVCAGAIGGRASARHVWLWLVMVGLSVGVGSLCLGRVLAYTL